LVQIAGDAEEGTNCAGVTGDEDGDGFTGQNFDGDDCDDTSPALLGIGDCDGDGVATADDCDGLIDEGIAGEELSP